MRSIRYRGLVYKLALAAFATAFVLLGALGFGATATMIPHLFGPRADVGAIENAFRRVLVATYFGFFAFVWAYTRFGFERTKALPARVT